MHALHLFIAALALFISPLASAHSDQPSHEDTVNGYVVDVGYETATPAAGNEVLFNFDLFTGTGDTLQFASFDTVTFTVTQGKSLTAEESVPNVSPNVPSLRYAFPEAGAYEVTVAYSQSGSELVRDTFPMTVMAMDPEKNATASDVFLMDAVIIVVICVAFFLLRKRMRR